METATIDQHAASHDWKELRALEERLSRVVEPQQTLVRQPHRGKSEETDAEMPAVRRLATAQPTSRSAPHHSREFAP